MTAFYRRHTGISKCMGERRFELSDSNPSNGLECSTSNWCPDYGARLCYRARPHRAERLHRPFERRAFGRSTELFSTFGFRDRTGFFVGLELPPASAVTSAAMLGAPSPVTRSYPGAALYAPFEPWTTSLNAALPASWYKEGFR